MKAGILTLPLMPLRSEPSERSEMMTQLLFGELFEVLEEQDNWTQIRNLTDGYVGWCTTKMLTLLPPSVLEGLRATSPHVTEALLVSCTHHRKSVPPLFLPAGSRLYDYNASTGAFSIFGLCDNPAEKTTWTLDPNSLTSNASSLDLALPSKIIRMALCFINAPYLWGGKSILGIDCSGLTQVSASVHGVYLPRDARDQALLGETVSLSEALPGDLAFFSNPEGRIVHVGMLLDKDRILHASGCVHLDRLDNDGIFSETLNRHTHTLDSIKRIFVSFKA